jgi:hypothetical protein
MSHSDTIKELPTNGELLASTKDVENAAYKIQGEETYAIQFHPEVYHTSDGKQLLENFLVKIAGVAQTWTPDSFVESTVAAIKEKVGSDKVVLGLSEQALLTSAWQVYLWPILGLILVASLSQWALEKTFLAHELYSLFLGLLGAFIGHKFAYYQQNKSACAKKMQPEILRITPN